MSNQKQKKNSIGKWICYGLLVIATILIFVFSAQIFNLTLPVDENGETIVKNEFVRYVVEQGVGNLARSIVIIGIAATLAILVSLIAKLTFKSKKAQTISKLFVSFLKWIIAICAVFFVISAWGASTTIT